MATTLDAYANLFDKSLPLFIRLQGLAGQQLSPSAYQQVLTGLYKNTFADPAYVQQLRDEQRAKYLSTPWGRKYPDAPPAAGGIGDSAYESAQAEDWKNYVQEQLKKAGISQGSSPANDNLPVFPAPNNQIFPAPNNQTPPVMNIQVGDDPALAKQKEQEAQDQYLKGLQQSTPLTEEEIYRQERDKLLNQADENLEKMMPAPSPVEVNPAPDFQNLVNQQREQQALQENKQTTEEQAQETQDAFQDLVNNARQNNGESEQLVAGLPLAIPAAGAGLNLGGAVLTGLGAGAAGAALTGAAGNIKELFTPSANVQEKSAPNPLIEKLQDAAPTVMGIFGLGKKKPTGRTKATYGGKSQEQIKREKALEKLKRNLPPARQGQPGKGRGMGDTWEGPQANVSTGERSQTIAQASTSTPSRTKVRPELAAFSPSRRRRGTSRSATMSYQFQSAVNRRRRQRSAFV